VIDPVLPPPRTSVIMQTLVTLLIGAAVVGVFYIGYC
jgi:hypothetical protein